MNIKMLLAPAYPKTDAVSNDPITNSTVGINVDLHICSQAKSRALNQCKKSKDKTLRIAQLS
ncbi:hypothetical protein QWZ16_18685 [Vibrio ostreicida]|uniref:Uncharacterized protein n=1 Tax=Vibrio ostreicida TaxID=526588 RepID=A0ABT8BZ52_9VIBR|nr:hypothetical protein [Vibrio ostreicida]MDN3611629.1 hypothetical protein [Vibrio ostreicida]